MIDIEKRVVYKAFGLRIFSEFPLPELLPVSIGNELVDVDVCRGDLSTIWSQLAIPNEVFVVKENFVMFQISNTATFVIQDGNKITISPFDGADEDKIRLYLLGTCMGALLMQRRVLPLHGSAVAIDGKAYAFIGDSGAGKSTLAAALLNRGYPLLSDDVIAISLSQDHLPIVMPSYAQQKLWKESLHNFGMETEHYRPIYERETKFSIPVPSQYAAEPTLLAGIFVLHKTDYREIEVHPVSKLERLQAIFCHTYRNFLISPLAIMDWHFHITSNMINKVDVFHLCRPDSRFTAHDLASLILHIIKKG